MLPAICASPPCMNMLVKMSADVAQVEAGGDLGGDEGELLHQRFLVSACQPLEDESQDVGGNQQVIDERHAAGWGSGHGWESWAISSLLPPYCNQKTQPERLRFGENWNYQGLRSKTDFHGHAPAKSRVGSATRRRTW